MFPQKLLLLPLLLLLPAAKAAPTEFNGKYSFVCGQATMKLKLILADSYDGGSLDFLIYCGPNPPSASDPQTVLDAWDGFQARMNTAQNDFATACNDLIATLSLPPRPTECSTAAAEWRRGLEELNFKGAGLAPAQLDVVVNAGNLVNEASGLWGTSTTLTLRDGSQSPLEYVINNRGEILTLALGGSNSVATANAGCAGVLLVLSRGNLNVDGTSTLVNDWGGLLACGVNAGDYSIAMGVTVELNAASIQTGGSAATESPEPPDDGGSTPFEDLCFSGETEVEVENKPGWTPMKDIKIGDRIQTTQGFSTVYSFGHKSTKAETHYLQIKGQGMSKPLEISAEHMIFTIRDGKNMLVSAGDLQVGNILVTVERQGNGTMTMPIESISTITRNGAYSPLTTSGTLLVNGVAASNYVSREWINQYSFVSPEMLHALQHGSLMPYRLYFWLFGMQDEQYHPTTGFSPFVQFWYQIEQWQLQLNAFWRLIFFVSMTLPAFLLIIAGSVSWLQVSAAAVYAGLFYLTWRNQQQRHLLK